MSVLVDVQDCQLKTHHFRNYLKSKVFLFSEESFCMNSIATNVVHVLEMAMIQSKDKESIRRGPHFSVRDDFIIHVFVVWT